MDALTKLRHKGRKERVEAGEGYLRNTGRKRPHAGIEFGKPKLSGVKLPRNAHRG